MEAFALYLFKSIVWLTGFALVYLLFLRNERYFLLNRLFLITGIVASVIFPFFTWHYTIVIPMVPSVEVSDLQLASVPKTLQVVNAPEIFPTKTILFYAYLAGALYLLYRIIRETITVVRVIRNSEILPYRSAKLIRTDAYPSSFSFFSFVFVNPSSSETETGEIVNHEMEHVRQRHWIDLLLFELLCTLQWLNPMVWLYGRFIRQNHEFLADQRALQRTQNPAIYRAALINQLFGGEVISLANSFNYSINKKRFHMMKNTIHPPYRKLKLLVILPLIAAVFYAFATPEYKYVELSKNSTFIQESTSATGNVPAEIRDTVKSSITTLEGNFIASSPMGETSPISGFRFTAKSIQGLTGKGSETVRGEDISLDLGNTTSTIFINDKEVTKAEFDKLDPNTIASVSILKGEAAINKFGDKGKNGVILISLKKDESNAYTQVEQMPEFPGGEEALKAFITTNIKYPALALENGIHGLVVVKFVVDKTGSIPSAKITRGVDPALDNEALRIVTAMPKWNPGKHNGENVAAEYELPINFKLPDDYDIKRNQLFIYYQTGIKPEDQAPETKMIRYGGVAGNGKNKYTLENSDYSGEIEVSIIGEDGKLVRKETKYGPSFILDYHGLNGHFYIYTKVGSIQYIGNMSVSHTIVKSKSYPNKKAVVKPGINQATQDHELIIVPNPTGDRATITLKDSDYNSKLQVSIFDKNGKLIGKDSKTGPTFNLSFANYTSGNYFIVVKADKDQYSGQLIVNH